MYTASFCNGDIEDQLSQRCYCPGDDDARLIPELMGKILAMGREKAKTAQIQRFPVPTTPGIPPIEVLKGIKNFKSYTRAQLLEIKHEDLRDIAAEAEEQRALMNTYANVTVINRSQIYEALKIENEGFVQNMTEKKTLILEAQELVRNPPENDAQVGDGQASSQRKRRNTDGTTQNLLPFFLTGL